MINYYNYRQEFLELFPTNSIGLELGVFKGDFSKLILQIVKPSEFHLIDVWWTLYGDYYPNWEGYTDNGNLKTKEAYDELISNISEFQDVCCVHVGDDLEILEGFTDNYFDWVYIDSSHNYSHTKKELLLLDRKVKVDGFITGHDWRPDRNHIHNGVYQAVIEFTEKTNWKVVYLDNHSQWCLKKFNLITTQK